MDLSVIVVTSPSPTHPSSALVDAVVDSLRLLGEAHLWPILVIADGYVVVEDSKARSKRGRVTARLAASYDEHLAALVLRQVDDRQRVLRMDRHIGFAKCVKRGLEECGTTFALVLQHDRIFFKNVGQDLLTKCIDAMEADETIRYIGFPSINNNQHDEVLSTMGLNHVNRPPLRRSIAGLQSAFLQPLGFYYDSNHLVHVKRVLEIYQPFKHFPGELRERLGEATAKALMADLLLRDGDFIEDRFGQAMRRCLMLLRARGPNEADTALTWFGCYLLWVLPTDTVAARQRANVFVSHLRGRQRGEEAVISALQVYTAGESVSDELKPRVSESVTSSATEIAVFGPLRLSETLQHGEDDNEERDEEGGQKEVDAEAGCSHQSQCTCCSAEVEAEVAGLWAWQPKSNQG